MRTLIAVLMLSLMVGVPAAGNAQTKPAPAHKPEATAHAPSSGGLTKDAAFVGGAVLGLVIASGVVGFVNAGTMAWSGTAIADALESGAGLTMPMALVGAALGAVLGQETALRNINWMMGHEAGKGGH